MADKTGAGTAEVKEPAKDVKPDVKEEKKEEKDVDQKKQEGPPKDSLRWNEVYGSWKSAERQLKEREKDIDALREHNRDMSVAIEEIKASKADRVSEPSPVPSENRDGYSDCNEKKLLDIEE